jgi:L-alanine-DL-glutamate epimerase-like enolase superfamily enzyme
MLMKITDLRVFPTEGSHSNWTFVKLYTDSGLTGVREASLERFDEAVVKALESFKGFLVGKDPFQIEYIWIPNCVFQEFFFPYLELYNEMLTEPIKCQNGYLEIPTSPGLGSDINEEFILKRPPVPQPPLATWIGSYW